MPVHFNEVTRSANHNEKPLEERTGWRSGLKFAPGLERPNANLWTLPANNNAATRETWRGINTAPTPHGPYSKSMRKTIAERSSAVFQNAAVAAAAQANAPAGASTEENLRKSSRGNKNNNINNNRRSKRPRKGSGRKQKKTLKNL